MHRVLFRSAHLGIASPARLCFLYNSLVRLGMDYGAQVWGPEALLAGGREVLAGDDEEHVAFLRRGRRGRRGRGSATRLVVMAELARWPLRCRCDKLVTRFWQRLHSLLDELLVKRSFLDNLELAAEQPAAAGDAAPCWAAVGVDALEPVLLVARDLPARMERVLQRRHLWRRRRRAGPRWPPTSRWPATGTSRSKATRLMTPGSYLHEERIAQICALPLLQPMLASVRVGLGPASERGCQV
jgi:hypothetical protein